MRSSGRGNANSVVMVAFLAVDFGIGILAGGGSLRADDR